MDRVEKLRRERVSAASVWHQFILQYNRRSKTIHAFFEGRDDRSFYITELKKRFKDIGDVFSIVCDGKEGVIEAYKRISPRVRRKSRILFFLDKDSDDLLKINRIPKGRSVFVTKYYSIENYIVSEEVFCNVLEILWDMNPSASEYKYSKTVYLNSHARFCRIMTSIMAWIVTCKRSGNKVNVNNIRLENILSISPDGIINKKKKRVEELSKACCVSAGLPFWSEVKSCIYELQTLDPKLYIRGKYEAWFFVKLLNALRAYIASLGKKLSIRTSISRENFIEVLVQYMSFPSEFDEFVNYHLARLR